MNSVWSRFIMKSLSVGVSSVFSCVNCLSKFDTSLRCFCNTTVWIGALVWQRTDTIVRISLTIRTLFRKLRGYTNEETHDLRLEGWLHVSRLDARPVDAAEEWVRAHVLLAASVAAEPLLRVLRQERLARVLCFLRTREQKVNLRDTVNPRSVSIIIYVLFAL